MREVRRSAAATNAATPSCNLEDLACRSCDQLVLPWLQKYGQGVNSMQLHFPWLHSGRTATVPVLPCQQLRELVITGATYRRTAFAVGYSWQASVRVSVTGRLLPEAACSTLTKLVLQGVQVPRPARQRFVAAIQSCTCLQHLELHVVAGVSGAQLLGSLQQLTGLTSLLIDATTEQLEGQLGGVTRLTNLQTLSLYSCSSGDNRRHVINEPAAAVAVAAAAAVAVADHLAGIERLTRLTKLALGLPGVQQQHLEHSSSSIGQLVGLQELTLWFSCLPLTVLSGLTGLKSLALHELRDVPLEDVYTMIGQLQLTSLRLSGRGVVPAVAADGTFDEDTVAFLSTMTASSQLQRLDLSGARICWSWQVEDIFPVGLQLPLLTSLQLPKGPSGNFVARPMSAADAEVVVACCPALQELDAGDSMTADTTALSSLQHLTGLSVLRLSTQRSRSSPLTSSLRSLQLSVNWDTVLTGPARVWDTYDLSPVVQLCTHSVLTAISFGVGAGTRPMTQRALSKVAELSTAGSLRSLDISGFHITQEFLPHLCTLTHLTSLTLHTVGLPSILADRLEYYGSIPPGQDPLLKGLVQLKSQGALGIHQQLQKCPQLDFAATQRELSNLWQRAAAGAAAESRAAAAECKAAAAESRAAAAELKVAQMQQERKDLGL